MWTFPDFCSKEHGLTDRHVQREDSARDNHIECDGSCGKCGCSGIGSLLTAGFHRVVNVLIAGGSSKGPPFFLTKQPRRLGFAEEWTPRTARMAMPRSCGSE